MQRRALASSQHNTACQGAGRLGGGKAVAALHPPAHEQAVSPPRKPAGPAAVAEESEDDTSPLSKWKDYSAVEALKGATPTRSPALDVQRQQHPAAERIKSASVAVDVALLVQSVLLMSDNGDGKCLGPVLQQLADTAVLAMASDGILAKLFDGLGPLLSFIPAARQWTVPGVATILGPLQAACQERLSRTTLPCDSELAATAARFFARVIRKAGDGCVSDDLLAAAAAYVHGHCRQLSSEVLASLHSLLVTARHQLPDPVAFGNAVTERLLRLNHAAKGGLPLQHLADVVEALAQLRCIDGLSAAPVVNLAASRARAMEEGGIYEAPALVQLARVMNCVAVIAATTPVQGSTLLAASAIWHLLVVRAEALAQSAAGDSQLAAPTAACLSKMWFASKLLLAVSKATTNGFQLPDRLGLVSHAAWLAQEQCLVWGLTSAQRRVLAALTELKVPPSKLAVNHLYLDIIPVTVKVRMCVASSNQEQQVAILIRDPLRQLVRGSCQALGAEEAQALILKAAGWHVVRLDSQTCLQLPCSTLADELGALLMEDPARSSLRFAA